jgi:hypothetical protein
VEFIVQSEQIVQSLEEQFRTRHLCGCLLG